MISGSEPPPGAITCKITHANTCKTACAMPGNMRLPGFIFPEQPLRRARSILRCLSGRLAPALLTLSWLSPVQGADLSEIYKLSVKNDPQFLAAEATLLSRRQVASQGRAQILPSIAIRGTTSLTKREFLSRIPDYCMLNDVMGERRPECTSVGVPQGGSVYEKPYNDHAWQAVLNQPIFRLDSWYRFRLGKSQRAEAVAQFASAQQQLLLRVAESYFSILERHAALSASNAERDAVHRQLEQVQQRFDVGLVAITDVLEAQAAYDSSTVNVIEAEGGHSTSFEPLLRLTGSRFQEVNGLSDDFPVKPPEPLDEEAWVKVALEHNYDLIAARARLLSAKRNLSIARAGHSPTIDAEVSYAHSVSDSPGFLGQGTKIDQTVSSLTINIPIFQGGALVSRTRQAGYDLDAAQQNLDLTHRQVVESTRNLFTTINTDVARVKARRRGIESSQSALDATQTGYEVGTRNIVDVLLAQQRLYLSQFQYASARYQYIRDTLRLKQAAGILNPDDLYGLNKYIDKDLVITRVTPTTR